MEPNLEQGTLTKLNYLIPKGIDILTNLLDLYKQKQSVKSEDVIKALGQIKRQDLEWAVQLLQQVNGKKTSKTNSALSLLMSPPKGMTEIPHNISDAQMAQNLFKAILITASADQYPSADELLNTLQIQDPKVRKNFEKEYEKTMKATKKTAKTNPVDANLYRWGKFGQFFFYGSIVVVILIILRKLYEGFIYVTDQIRRQLATFIMPKNTRYVLNLWNWGKRTYRKYTSRPSIPSIPGNQIIIQQGGGDRGGVGGVRGGVREEVGLGDGNNEENLELEEIGRHKDDDDIRKK